MVTTLATVAHIPKMMPMILSVDSGDFVAVAWLDVEFRASNMRREIVAIVKFVRGR